VSMAPAHNTISLVAFIRYPVSVSTATAFLSSSNTILVTYYNIYIEGNIISMMMRSNKKEKKAEEIEYIHEYIRTKVSRKRVRLEGSCFSG